jgi:hypothetical protein
MIPFVLSYLVAAQAAQAADPPPGAAPVVQSQIVVVGRRHTPDRVVCRTIVETGSRIPEGRVCQHESEWDQERRRNQLDAERMVADSRDYNQQLVAHDGANGPH